MDAIRSSSMRTSYCLSWERVWEGLYLLGSIRRGDSFLFLQSLSEAQPLWFNAYSVRESFLSLLPLWSGFLSWEKVLFLMMFPQWSHVSYLLISPSFFLIENRVFLSYLKFKFTLFICRGMLILDEILTAYTLRMNNVFSSQWDGHAFGLLLKLPLSDKSSYFFFLQFFLLFHF